MTYNIKYANEADGENSWSKRKEFLGNQIAFHEPHILCLQEVLKEQLTFLRSRLSNFDFIGEGRDGRDEGEFTPILYNTSRFQVVRHDTFWLSETPDKRSKGWDAAYRRICTYGLFKDHLTDQEFWIFNTHLDHKGEEARKRSAELLVQKITEVNFQGLPVLLTGDFNLVPSSEAISYLSSKLTDSKEAATEASFGPDGTFNAFEYHQPVTRRIDYVFFSPEKVKVLKYGVLSESIDMKFPSDHFPVMVKIALPSI